MDFNEALNVVRQVKGRYQAFEKLEEVLTFSANLDATINEKSKRVSSLVDKEAALRAAVDQLVTQKEEREKDYEARVAELTAKYADLAAKLDADHKQRLAVISADHNSALQRSQIIIDSLNEEQAKLQQQVRDLQGRVDGLKAQHAEVVSTLKSKLGLE